MTAFVHDLELGRASCSWRPEGPRSRRYNVREVGDVARGGGGPEPPGHGDPGGGTTSNFRYSCGEAPAGRLGVLNGLTPLLLALGRPRALV